MMTMTAAIIRAVVAAKMMINPGQYPLAAARVAVVDHTVAVEHRRCLNLPQCFYWDWVGRPSASAS
jgi:hypothetical protein